MSTRRPNKLPELGQEGFWLWLGLLGVLLVVVGGWFLAYVAAALAGHGAGGPGVWLLDPGPQGRWSGQATVYLAAFLVPLAGLGWVAVRAVLAARKGRQWTDRSAKWMSTREDMAELLPEAVAADTERLGSQKAGIGVSLAKSVLTGQWLYGTYEWCQVWIMGTRAGKTRSVAVTQLVEHQGPAVATSNKRDIVYLTRGPRSELGRCWIFDPQHMYREGVTFWWNPLSYVTSTWDSGVPLLESNALERAEKLAAIWLESRSASEASASEDPYFGPAGRTLLTNMVLAAAVGRQPVTMILTWLQGPRPPAGTPDPVKILREHGFDAVADSVDADRKLVPETRDGVFAGARSGVLWLRNPQFTQWVTPPPEGSEVPEFSTADLVRSTDTIYLLSKDGPGSARALVGALTAALWEAGREYAEEVGDRVPVPVLFTLDECANIVRWGELPSLFSYSGSLGLILVVILQSRAQGQRCWGKEGFTEMWSTANITFVGRGINDEEHLAAMASLIGDRQKRDRSVSTSTGHNSTSTSLRDERIFTEADLRALPRGRGVLMVAGTRPILAELVDYSRRRDAERIEASKEAFFQPWMGSADDQTTAANAVVAGEVVDSTVADQPIGVAPGAVREPAPRLTPKAGA